MHHTLNIQPRLPGIKSEEELQALLFLNKSLERSTLEAYLAENHIDICAENEDTTYYLFRYKTPDKNDNNHSGTTYVAVSRQEDGELKFELKAPEDGFAIIRKVNFTEDRKIRNVVRNLPDREENVAVLTFDEEAKEYKNKNEERKDIDLTFDINSPNTIPEYKYVVAGGLIFNALAVHVYDNGKTLLLGDKGSFLSVPGGAVDEHMVRDENKTADGSIKMSIKTMLALLKRTAVVESREEVGIETEKTAIIKTLYGLNESEKNASVANMFRPQAREGDDLTTRTFVNYINHGSNKLPKQLYPLQNSFREEMFQRVSCEDIKAFIDEKGDVVYKTSPKAKKIDRTTILALIQERVLNPEVMINDKIIGSFIDENHKGDITAEQMVKREEGIKSLARTGGDISTKPQNIVRSATLLNTLAERASQVALP